MEMPITPPALQLKGQERYLRLPKTLATPETAEGLFSLFGELRRGKTANEQYSAGWAIAEAGLASTNLPAEDRETCMYQAERCWVKALQIQQAQALRRCEAKGKSSPNRSAEYRIASALAAVPVLAELPYGAPRRQTMAQFHSTLLCTAKLNVTDMLTEVNRRNFNTATNYEGLAFEHLTQLSVSRKMGRRLFACSAFARSDNGTHHPSQTHDVQILHLNGGAITTITPTEVKRQLREEFFEHYQDVSLMSGLHLMNDGEISIPSAIRLFSNEEKGCATDEELLLLDGMTDSVIHSIQHYQRPERYGKHCLLAMEHAHVDAAGEYIEPQKRIIRPSLKDIVTVAA